MSPFLILLFFLCYSFFPTSHLKIITKPFLDQLYGIFYFIKEHSITFDITLEWFEF